MKIIALDLGSNMGLAHNVLDVPIFEHKEFKGIRAHRAFQTEAWLRQRFCDIITAAENTQIDCVIYERPFARGFDATRSLWGLAGIVEALATEFNWPVVDQVPLPIKKWATRKAKASKEEMIEAAIRLGCMTANEHEADAFLLLKYAEANLEKTNAK